MTPTLTTIKDEADELVPSQRLEQLIGTCSPSPSEAHDMAVELIRRRAHPPIVDEGMVERVLSELSDRRLLNDVDPSLFEEIAVAIIRAVRP